jgi:hypothetical protein
MADLKLVDVLSAFVENTGAEIKKEVAEAGRPAQSATGDNALDEFPFCL